MSTIRRLKKLGLITHRGLYDYEIKEYAAKMKIAYFRDVYDRQNLPVRPFKYEALVLNLDDIDSPGTHWVALRKIDNIVIYFDSYGDLPPPKEIFQYLNNYDIYYNHRNYQNNSSVICGQLCIEFLINTSHV